MLQSPSCYKSAFWWSHNCFIPPPAADLPLDDTTIPATNHWNPHPTVNLSWDGTTITTIPFLLQRGHRQELVVGMSYKMSDNMLSVILWTDKLRNLWPPEVPPGGLYGATWWQNCLPSNYVPNWPTNRWETAFCAMTHWQNDRSDPLLLLYLHRSSLT